MKTLGVLLGLALMMPVVGNAEEYCAPSKRKLSLVNEFPENKTGDANKPNPGNLEMFVYVPKGLPQAAPVVLNLHGCAQSTDAYEKQAEMSKLADLYKFVLVMPKQVYAPDKNSHNINNSLYCFSWNGVYGHAWDRDQGEAASIKQMVDKAVKDYQADPSRVYMVGFSAGGSMAVRMCAQYPDVFASCAFQSSAPYMCGNPKGEVGDVVRIRALDCMGVDDNEFYTPRVDKQCPTGVACATDAFMSTKKEITELVVKRGYQKASKWPRIMIWHGTEDQVVDPRLSDILRDQWLLAHNVTGSGKDIKLNAANGKYTAKAYGDGENPQVVQVKLTGMKHGIAVDPGGALPKGGVENTDFWTGGYSYDWDVYSSQEILEFFGIATPKPEAPSCAGGSDEKDSSSGNGLEMKI